MEDLTKQFHALLFGVRRSIRYHNRRTRFFDRLHTVSTFISALAGTATVASALGQAGREWIISAALLVTVFSVLDLVVGSARLARLHSDLARRFFELEKAINVVPIPTEEDLIRLTNERLDIEKDEPPPLKNLDSICHNELLRAMGYDPSEEVQIEWYQRLFANFLDIREHTVH